MKTKTITLYEYSELSPEAKEKAYSTWRESEDDPMMQSHMINLLKEELDERGIQYDTDSIDVRYSLTHSQGDGFMFEGELEWSHYSITIKHSGHYCHSNSKMVEMQEHEGTEFHTEDEDEFEKLYQAICKKMECVGYEHIEYITSEESFEQACEDNEWTFREDGRMENV